MKLQDGLRDKVQILVIGDVIVDKYVFGKTNRISPEAPIPILDVLNVDSRLGGAGNVALNLKKLDRDCKVHLLGVVGNDISGNWVKDNSQELDISSFFISTKDMETNTKTRFIDESHLLRVDNSPVNAEYDISESIDLAFNNIKWDMVIISDYDFGVLHKRSIDHIMSLAKCPVIVDPKYKNFWLYNNVYCLKPNRKELTQALYQRIGKSMVDTYDLDYSLQSLTNELIERNKADHVIVTDGSNGMLWYDRSKHNITPEYTKIDAIDVTLKDVTGAGDTVISTLGYCLAKGYSFEQSINYSNVAAAKSVTQIGCGYVEFRDIETTEVKYNEEALEWHRRELENIQV